MNEPWYALCISILANVTPEEAFDMLDGDFAKNNWKKFITNDDIEDMIKLKEECTYKEIGEMYGLDASSIYQRIKRYKQSCIAV